MDNNRTIELDNEISDFIRDLPKVELHVHIEGTLEPELMFQLAERNQITLPYKNTDEIREAYQFTDLQSFLDIYYAGANVLLHEQDFFDLTWAYLSKCQQDNVVHTEIFFDPQTHTARDIEFDIVLGGITKAMNKAESQLGVSSKLIMCFLRHLSEEDAFATLEQALPHKDKIIGVGLDSSERGHPPEKFERVFAKAREEGFLTVAHAGEEGGPENIVNAINLLNVSRVDHGVRCVDDENLVQDLAKTRMPLTVCPLSNIKLKVFQDMTEHNIVDLLKRNLCVTINSDDPAYFGGYMNDNFFAVAKAHPMSREMLAQFSLNAIDAAFLEPERKQQLRDMVEKYLAA